MRIHESHDEGGFSVSNNTITRHAASYTTNTRFVAFLGTFARPAQQVWLPGNDLQDPSSLVAPPLCTLNRLHGDLLQQYDCTEQSAVVQPAQPSDATACGAAANAGAHPQPHAGSQDHGNGKLLLPQLDCLHLAFKRPKSVIPTQCLVTEQLTKNWAPFNVLRQLYAGTRFEEKRCEHRRNDVNTVVLFFSVRTKKLQFRLLQVRWLEAAGFAGFGIHAPTMVEPKRGGSAF
jgi:hypothetical protein